MIRVVATALILSVGLAFPAAAACQKLGFSVNDYGKEGPIRDAKAMLDKYIADWAAKEGISKYRTGKKDVSCELFLDFGFFDEHTCKATATVCWDKRNQSSGRSAASKPVKKAPAAAKPAPAKKTEAPAAAPRAGKAS